MIEIYILLSLLAALVSIFAVIFLWGLWDDFYGEEAMADKRLRRRLENKKK